jgi:uncharacterized protein
MRLSGWVLRLAIVVILTGAIIPAAARADVRQGVEAWQRGDFKQAVDEWRPLAISGDPDAQFNLGQAYKLGRGVPVDPSLAEQWFGKAAAQNHPQAIVNYALALFQNGKHDDAVPWLEKAVAQGEPRAQLVLGTMLFNGDSIARDWVRAYALIVRAAAAGIPKAAETQAQMDQYIDTDQRQKGIALARQYESQHGIGKPIAELAGSNGSSPDAIRKTELPPSGVGGQDGGPIPTPAQVKPASTSTKTRNTPPPKPPLANTSANAAVAPSPGGAWRIQLGAFRDKTNARKLWEQLRRRATALATYQPYFLKSGPITRLLAGPLATNADATRLCAAVKAAAAGTACLPVAR